MNKRHHVITPNDNFFYLMLALVLLLLSTAVAQQFFDTSIQRLVQSTTVITLIIVVWGVKSENALFSKTAIYPIAIIVASAAGYWLDKYGLAYMHLLLMLAFFVSSAIQIAKQVLLFGPINLNKIVGAICLYLLLGLIWALLYTLSEVFFDTAFNGIAPHLEWYLLFPDFVYFSFVTLTTLGFGDVSPSMPITRFLVYFQAVLGQFYLAVLVASLVGSHMSQRQSHTKNDES